jgi:hypothetical protein
VDYIHYCVASHRICANAYLIIHLFRATSGSHNSVKFDSYTTLDRRFASITVTNDPAHDNLDALFMFTLNNMLYSISITDEQDHMSIFCVH